jgi:hypothetical protein
MVLIAADTLGIPADKDYVRIGQFSIPECANAGWFGNGIVSWFGGA